MLIVRNGAVGCEDRQMQAPADSEELPKFRFHPNAYDLGAFESVVGRCDACRSDRTLRYTGSFYAVDEVEYICPWCVADGTAARLFDGEFSDYAGIEGIPPEPGSPATVDLDEAIEVCTRTPSYPSWQQEQWPSHCGRPCAFMGDIGASDLPRYQDEPDFAADVDGGLGWDPPLLRTHLTAGGDLAGYLFQCLSCGAHRLHVDAS
ncbi:CbrC family protein [Microbacterium sp. NPDC087592]|uniref:CbrC family protein n=1 Tax=Microbacterium sp. NPDC087592 TaxID=3364193 RepID=UPI00382FF338